MAATGAFTAASLIFTSMGWGPYCLLIAPLLSPAGWRLSRLLPTQASLFEAVSRLNHPLFGGTGGRQHEHGDLR